MAAPRVALWAALVTLAGRHLDKASPASAGLSYSGTAQQGYTRSAIISVRASYWGYWGFTARSATVCLTLLPGLALCSRHFRAY